MVRRRIVQRDFRDYRRDRFVDAQTSAIARLARTLMLTNELGVNGDIPDELVPDDWARVEFDIPSAQVKSAEVLFYVKSPNSTQEKPLRLLVNENRINHYQKVERRLGGGWDRARILARFQYGALRWPAIWVRSPTTCSRLWAASRRKSTRRGGRSLRYLLDRKSHT